jgi:hypothetical protein
LGHFSRKKASPSDSNLVYEQHFRVTVNCHAAEAPVDARRVTFYRLVNEVPKPGKAHYTVKLLMDDLPVGHHVRIISWLSGFTIAPCIPAN